MSRTRSSHQKEKAISNSSSKTSTTSFMNITSKSREPKKSSSSLMITPIKQSQKENISLDKMQKKLVLNNPSSFHQSYNLRSSAGDRHKTPSSSLCKTPPKDALSPRKKNHKTLIVNKGGSSTYKFKTPQKGKNTQGGNRKSNLEEEKTDEEGEEDEKRQTPEIKCHFATERINLPRGKVIRCNSSLSSAYGSKRNSQSPVKLPKTLPVMQEPIYEVGKIDYFKEYWRLYFQNESLVADIEQTAHSNYKVLKKIYNLEDYYEHNLIPQLLTYPHKFVHRLRQQQLQKQQQQQKLMLQQKQQQEILQQMKSKDCQILQQHQHHHHSSSSENNKEQSSLNEQSASSSIGVGRNSANVLSISKDRQHKRKKHLRRTAAEIEREFICPYAECGKFYGSEGSLNLHIKIKHNGGNKTEREKLAKTLVQAFVNGSINKEIEALDLNLPPGALQKAVKKAGLVQSVSENEILRKIQQQLQQQQAVVNSAAYKINNE